MSTRVRYRMPYLNGSGAPPPFRSVGRVRRALTPELRTETCPRCGFKSTVHGVRTHASVGCLPAAPLVQLVASRGGPSACGVWADATVEKAYLRAAASGRLTYRAADSLAVKLLGLTTWEVWGDAVA